MLESLANSVGCNTIINCSVTTMYLDSPLPLCVYGCVCACACVLCMTLFRVLMLTVGHDSTPKCICMLCMTVSRSNTYSGS